LVRESGTSDPTPRFLFLSFGERDDFFENETDLSSAVANERQFIGAGTTVVHSLFRASNDFGYPLGAYPRLSFD